ncbi:hypothetical protein ABZ079_01980 [Streptomyces sp. NPDC006314]|uniref:hypothetical protein n=1 Tax=Streptomyces sp. NPDC006314 TaxID=3154475 RepID=UPI0033B110C5
MAGRSVLCAAAGITAALLLSPAPATAAHADAPAVARTDAAAAVHADDSGPSARALADEARANLLKARSVHLTFTDHHTRGGRATPASMDLDLDRAGNCVGRLMMSAGGGSVELVKRGDQVWMKPDTTFWKAQVPGRQGETVAEVFKDRYIHGSTHDSALRGMAGTCDLTAFQQRAAAGSAHGAKLTKGKETTRDGTKVIPLKGMKDGKKTVMYVTSALPHQLVEATRKGAGTDQSLTFTDYDEPVPSATPAANDSVDVSRLLRELRNA